MTCYILKNGYPQPVRSIVENNRVITNVPDEIILEKGLGYRLENSPYPEVQDGKKAEQHYEIEGQTIKQVWTIVDKTNQEKIQEYKWKIDEIYQQAEEYKQRGKILYPGTGKEYIPRWIVEFYNTILIRKEIFFPTPETKQKIAAVDGTKDELNYDEFLNLCNFIINDYNTKTDEQNKEIERLNALIKELEEQEEENE